MEKSAAGRWLASLTTTDREMPGTSGTSTWLSERLHSTVIIFVIKVIKRTGPKKNDVNSCSENFFTLFGKVQGGGLVVCGVFFLAGAGSLQFK